MVKNGVTSAFAVVLFLGAFTGCATLDVDEVVHNAVQAQQELDSYYAEVTTTTMMDGYEEEWSYQEWMKRPSQYRVEQDDGSVTVSDGTKAWIYDASQHTVRVFEDTYSMDEEMPDEADIMAEMIHHLMNNNTVDIVGKETISDRATIHLSIVPDPESDHIFASNMEMWIDEEMWMPLKVVMKEDTFEMEMIYENIDYNIHVDQHLFSFDIPEDAHVEHFENNSGLTVDEIKEKADFTIPQIINLPQGYILKESFYDENFDMAVLHYEHEEKMIDFISLTITPDEAETSYDRRTGREHEIVINENEAALFDGQGMFFLTWKQDGVYLELITNGEMSKDMLIQMAESVE